MGIPILPADSLIAAESAKWRRNEGNVAFGAAQNLNKVKD